MYKLPASLSIVLTLLGVACGVIINYCQWYRNTLYINKKEIIGSNILCKYYLYQEECFIEDWIIKNKTKTVTNSTSIRKLYEIMLSNRDKCNKKDIDCINQANLVKIFIIMEHAIVANMVFSLIIIILIVIRLKRYKKNSESVSKNWQWTINFFCSMLFSGISFTGLTVLTIFSFLRYNDYVNNGGYLHLYKNNYREFNNHSSVVGRFNERNLFDRTILMYNLTTLTEGDIIDNQTVFDVGIIFCSILSIINALVFIYITFEFYKFSKYFFFNNNFNFFSSLVEKNEGDSFSKISIRQN